MESSLTVRVSRSTHELLRQLAEQTGGTMAGIVDQSVRAYQRERFWADYHSAYQTLNADRAASAEYQAELDLWETSAADGLE